MEKILIAITLLQLLACGKPLPSPEAKQALEELQRLQSRTEVGINKQEYSKAVAEVKFAIEKFETTDDAKARPEFINDLKSALSGHLLLLSHWDKCTKDCTNKFPQLAAIFAKYPDVQTTLQSSAQQWGSPDEYIYSTEGVISEVWKRTGEETKKAVEALK